MWSIIQKLNDILPRIDKIRLGILFLMMLVAGVLQLMGLGMILGFISILSDADSVLAHEQLQSIWAFLNISTFDDLLLWGSLALGLIFLIKSTYLIFFNYVLSRFAHNKFRNIALALFRSYMYMPYHFHLQNNSATLIRNVIEETRLLLKWVLIPLLSIAIEVIMITTVLIFLIIIEPVITLISAITIGSAGFILIKILKKYEQRYGKDAQQSRGDLIRHVSEGLGGIKEISILNRQNYFVNRLRSTLEILKKAETFNEASKESFRPAIELIAVAGMLTLALIMASQGRDAEEIIATLTLFGVGAFQLLPSFAKITNQYSKLDYYGRSIIPIHENLMHTAKEMGKGTENASKEKLSLNQEIKLKRVNFTYPDDKKPVLKDISLVIPKGSAVGIVGKSGAGKTTLVDLILGLFEPDKGEVLVDGKSIFNNLEQWQNNIGYIPQVIYLADDTIRNNIAFGIPESEINDQRLNDAIRMAQLEEVIAELPNGINTIIGEQGVRLSGGQRQRIGIARALYHNPEVLVMDEATSALDNKTEQYIIEAIERLKGERTVVIIAHRLSTVENCDKLFMLQNGEVAKTSTYKKLYESK